MSAAHPSAGFHHAAVWQQMTGHHHRTCSWKLMPPAAHTCTSAKSALIRFTSYTLLFSHSRVTDFTRIQTFWQKLNSSCTRNTFVWSSDFISSASGRLTFHAFLSWITFGSWKSISTWKSRNSWRHTCKKKTPLLSKCFQVSLQVSIRNKLWPNVIKKRDLFCWRCWSVCPVCCGCWCWAASAPISVGAADPALHTCSGPVVMVTNRNMTGMLKTFCKTWLLWYYRRNFTTEHISASAMWCWQVSYRDVSKPVTVLFL